MLLLPSFPNVTAAAAVDRSGEAINCRRFKIPNPDIRDAVHGTGYDCQFRQSGASVEAALGFAGV
jgi:hypothetical protein